MANKVYPSFEAAVADIPDGAIIMIGGFGGIGGIPQNLITTLRNQGAKNLTIIHNTGGFGFGEIGYSAGYAVPRDVEFNDHAALVANKQVKRLSLHTLSPRLQL